MKTYIAPCDVGQGLFAGEFIRAGEPILEFRGPPLNLAQVREKGDLAANTLQVGLNLYLDLEPPGRLVNHSCSPNAGIFHDTRLVALTPIEQGEEIRFDYSTTIADGWTMPCLCGSPQCRGVVSAYLLLPASLRQRYAILGCVQRFMLTEWQA